MNKNEIADEQAKYADNWTKLIIEKRETDLRRKCEQPLGYYIHDGIRRILSDQWIEDPFRKNVQNIREYRRGWNNAMKRIKVECDTLFKEL